MESSCGPVATLGHAFTVFVLPATVQVGAISIHFTERDGSAER